MLLGLGESLVRIDLQERHIPYLGVRIAGVVAVLGSRIDAFGRRSVCRAARPGISFHRTRRGGSKAPAPHCPLAIMAISVPGGMRRNAVRPRVLIPPASRNIDLLEGGSCGQ